MKIRIGLDEPLWTLLFVLIAILTYSQFGLQDIVFRSTNVLYVYIIAITVFAIAIGLSKSKMRLRFSTDDILLTLMLLAVLLNRNGNLEHKNYLFELQFLFGVVLYHLLSNNANWYKAFTRVFFGFGMVFSSITIITYLSPDYYFEKIVPLFSETYRSGLIYTYNNSGMPGLTNHYSANAIYLSLLVLISIYYLKESRHKGLWSLLTLFNLIALFLTGKRAHVVFIVISIYFALYYQMKSLNNRVINVISALVGGIVGFMILSNFIPGVAAFIERFQLLSQSGDVSLGRGVRIQEALNLFFNNPLFGIGWDEFKYWHLAQRGEFINVHNIYVQLLSENGIVFGSAFFIWFGLFLFRAFKTKNRSKGHTFLSFSLMVFFLLYGLTGNPLYDSPMLLPYLIACAIIKRVYYLPIDNNEVKDCECKD